jgi:DNA-directed RNA polymerase specialized sigma24 family protein
MNDESLMLEFQQTGSQSAFDELCRKHRDRVRAYVQSFIGQRVDVVAEIFERLRQKSSQFNELKFLPWFYRLMFSAMTDLNKFRNPT